MSNLKIFQSRDLNLYKPILEGLYDELGFDYYHAVLVWCNVIDYNGYDKYYFWEVYLIERDGKIVGLAGLSSQYAERKDELWLGWFGVLPEYRNEGIGSEALKLIEEKAKSFGCDTLMTYIDKSCKPLKFYQRNNFMVLWPVEKYLKIFPEIPEEAFGDKEDIVLIKNL